jgi:hypothetical protein
MASSLTQGALEPACRCVIAVEEREGGLTDVRALLGLLVAGAGHCQAAQEGQGTDLGCAEQG